MKNNQYVGSNKNIDNYSRLSLLKEHINIMSNIKKIPFLSSVPEEALLVFLEKSKTMTYPKHSLIISEGGKVNSFFIILSGKVRVFCSNENNEVTINILGNTACFGEAALFNDNNSPVSVMAQEKTVCLVILKDDLINWLLNYIDVSINLLDALSGEIIQLTNKVRQLALLNVYERVVIVLKDITKSDVNINISHNHLSQQELANMVGASREMVCKVMHELTKGGYIVSKNKAWVINKTPPASW